jgi:ZIP family zinc transporter
MQTLTVILIPLAGTVLGSATALFMKKQLSSWIERLLLGFASGVMIAASVWSLLLPSLEQTEGEWMPAAIGFITGVGFLLAVDTLTPHLNVHSREREGTLHLGRNKTAEINKISSHTMLYIAVTIHNFPEGMAVGAVLAGIFSGSTEVGYAGAMVLAIGIGVQNFPEGAIISMPLSAEGVSKRRAFGYGVLSGIIEPIGAIITILAAEFFTPILPYCLSLAAGAMFYVVVEELIPEMSEGNHSNIGTIAFAVGFSLMMIFDVALG